MLLLIVGGRNFSMLTFGIFLVSCGCARTSLESDGMLGFPTIELLSLASGMVSFLPIEVSLFDWGFSFGLLQEIEMVAKNRMITPAFLQTERDDCQILFAESSPSSRSSISFRLSWQGLWIIKFML